MEIIKKDETTYEEVIPEQVIIETKVEGTLDGLLADIAGTEAWLARAQQEVLDATAQLEVFNDKLESVQDLGIKTKDEYQAELDVIAAEEAAVKEQEEADAKAQADAEEALKVQEEVNSEPEIVEEAVVAVEV